MVTRCQKASSSTSRTAVIYAFSGISVVLLIVMLVLVLERGTAPSASQSSAESSADAGGARTVCDNLTDPLESDVCHWNRFVERELKDEPQRADECKYIRDPYMQYVCLRFAFRPHMREFVLQEPEAMIPEGIAGCHMQNRNIRRFCIMRAVSSLTSSNASEAARICASLRDAPLAGECAFYVAVGSVLGKGSGDAEGWVTPLMAHCGTISDDDWRAECYFLVADEMAFLRPVPPVELIVEACRGSMEAVPYYNCYNHAVMLLPTEEASTYCGLLDDEFRTDCIWGVGRAIGYSHQKDITDALDECRILFLSEEEHCIRGVAEAWGASTITIVESSKVCGKFPPEFQGWCILGASRTHAVTDHTDPAMNVTPIIEKCKEFLPKYQPFCFDLLISDLLQAMERSPMSPPDAAAKCEELPRESREDCLARVRRQATEV